jgi:hypothetical protein
VSLDSPGQLPFAIWAVVVFDDKALFACVTAFDCFALACGVLALKHADDGRVDVAVLVLVFLDQ